MLFGTYAFMSPLFIGTCAVLSCSDSPLLLKTLAECADSPPPYRSVLEAYSEIVRTLLLQVCPVHDQLEMCRSCMLAAI